MGIPNLSNAMYVAQLRHIQSIHETPGRRNPDILVRNFLPLLQRCRTAWLSQSELSRLRADPFYYYLVARTRSYDNVLSEAVSDGIQRILNVGCGSDTRAYRFEELLCREGVRVLECDQAEAIHEKQRLVKRWGHSRHVQHLPIDLNDGKWPELEEWLGDGAGLKTLALVEGVSPYVNGDSFGQFLELLADKLSFGSQIAYDFKIVGIKDEFGRDGRTSEPFRLAASKAEVARFHRTYGLRLEAFELSSELSLRLLSSLKGSSSPLFEEDGLVRLKVSSS